MSPTEALLGGFEFAPNTAASTSPARDHAQHSPQRQGFAVANLRLMIRYEEGSELAELPRLYPLPNVPPWFLGYANLQGVLVPVFDLARYLGIQAPAPEKPLLLVLSHGGNAAGVIIDGLPQRLRWSEEDRTDEGTAPSRLMPHLRGACRLGETLWFDLEVHSLLDALEQGMNAAA